jgi:hypothetical protein
MGHLLQSECSPANIRALPGKTRDSEAPGEENDCSGVAFLEEMSGFVRSRAPVPRIPSEFGRQDAQNERRNAGAAARRDELTRRSGGLPEYFRESLCGSMDGLAGHREYQAVMFFESRASRQNSAHHDAECVPLHHDGPAQEEQRSFDELQKKYSSSRCHLHKVDLDGAGSSLQSAIKANERAGLLASADNEIRIICVNLELLNDTNRIIKRNIKKTDRYLVILQQRLERFRQVMRFRLSIAESALLKAPLEEP